MACALVTALGCDQKPSGGAGPAASAATRSTAATAVMSASSPGAATPTGLPNFLVDAEGVFVGGERVALKGGDAAGKLSAALKKYPFAGKSPSITAVRNAPTGYVAKAVDALGAVGANEVVVRTPDRSRVDTAHTFTPQQKGGHQPDCTVVAMVLKDRATASWPARGGVATKFARGLAGPDLSMTVDGVSKQIRACDATALVVTGDDSVDWGLTFDLALELTRQQQPLKTGRTILPREAPSAGQSIKPGD